MQAEEEHRRGEQAGIVDAHRIHPLLGDVDVAMVLALGLVLLAQIVPGDAARKPLIADLAVEEGRSSAAAEGFHRLALDNWAFEIAVDLLVGLVLVMVRVDVDDQKVLIVALMRLLARVFERFRFGELVEIEVANLVANHVHQSTSCVSAPLQTTTKTSSPRFTTLYFRNFSRRSPA